MKKHWLVILALMLITSVFAYEVVAYHEDFESGENGWIHYDGAVSPNNWHVYNYGGTQGDVWWMGDPDLASGGHIGGYLSRQYLVLDTPARTLTAANATLTFKYRHGLEDPAVHEEYDGWDSCNIRLSTDGGATWTVIEGTPPYNFTSSYAFGSEHGEGPGIPGWGGMVTNWTNATFNLSAYVGQSVKIRFAFASDPAYDTTNDPALFGFMVDDIAFGGYTNNGVDDGQMTWASMVPLGGDLWHLGTHVAAPSPTHVMINQNDSGGYNQNMMNYLVSPPIALPSGGEIRADFMIMGEFSDSGTFPNTAYFGWEISPDGGETWNAMSNPYADPDLSNYVYSDAPSVWASMVDSYSLDGYISDYAGQTVRFRWFFKSPALPTNGPGIMIDDFKIYNDIFIAPPANLEAEVVGNSVNLSWEAPGGGGGGGEEGWLTYSGEPDGNAIGTGSAADFDVAHKWDPVGDNGIYPYVGMQITKIKFAPMEANCEYAVRIWTGAAGSLVYDQAVPNPIIGQWNEVVLTTPYTIPSGTVLMAGYRCNTQTGHPAGTDSGPAIDGYGNMMRLGSWGTLLAHDLDYNWAIQTYVADADGREYVIGEVVENEQFATGSFSSHKTRFNPSRSATGYRIYRNGILIEEVGSNTLNYTEINVEGGVHTYYVTAMYDANESLASNSVNVFVLPEMHAESYFDDGSSEMGLTVGSSRQMAVYHDTFDIPVVLKYAKVFVHTKNNSSIIVRVYTDDGANNLPGSMMTQVQYPAANVVAGWNYIPFPNDVSIESGKFYLAIMETPSASQIGVDTSANGHSFVNMGQGWSAYTQGEIMIRAIVYTGTEIQDVLNPPTNFAAEARGRNVHLSWDVPISGDIPPAEDGWITWCNVDDIGDAIGTDGPAVFGVYHMFDAQDLAPHQGNILSQVQFVPNHQDCVYTVKIWTGGTATTPADLIYSEVHTGAVMQQWNVHTLSSPLPMPADRLWIGYEVNTQGGFPAGCDDGPQVEGKGNIMYFNGWTTLSQVSASLTYNWSIQGYVGAIDGAKTVALSPIIDNPKSYTEGTLSLAHFEPKRNDRALLGYKVYRDGQLVHTINSGTSTEYDDMNLELGTYSYSLTAFYHSGESEAAGPVSVTIVDLPMPTDVAAQVDRNNVDIEWTSPFPPMEGEWITWCNVNVLGNSIGTGGATQFDVAHMFDATDLAAYQGGSIAQMKFVPGFQNCVYTVKIWTGGTASAPGTLVYQNVHENHVTGEWNLHILTTPVPVPSDRLWIGYHVNTQGGHPAGCDDGPMVPGKGNMMNFGGWTTLDDLNEALTYNWSIQGFVAEGGTMKSISLNPIPEIPTVATGELGLARFEPKRNTRALTGFRVYRDSQLLTQINNPDATTYRDWEVPNGDYIYGVSAVYHEGESEAATVAVTVNLELPDAFFEDGFEAYPDFALQFAPWSLLDQDGSDTYGITNYQWPNAYQPMAYMVFNPGATVPPLESVSAHSGNKMAASFAAVNGPNNDWLISPRVTLGTDSHVKFYAKSHTAQYGLERFRVGVSPLPTIIPQGFQYVSGPTHIEAPTNWTEYIYDISQHDGQSVFIAIRCVSDDAFIFYVDDFSIHSDGGVSNEDGVAPVYTTQLKGNYPNPFNPETTISYSLKENMPVNIGIYNIKGQLVKTLVNENKAAGEHSIVWNGVDSNNRAVSSGMYFFKMNAGKYSSTKKMIMMK